ncbi:MAG: hypothetical protein L0338_36700 [Acidobacteria bacterium]|nr:hypothetical protein [Acidobacteriota bacterium]
MADNPKTDEPSLAVRLFFSFSVACGTGLLDAGLGEGRFFDDLAFVSTALLALNEPNRRGLVVVLSALLLWLAFPPLCLPTYLFCFTPIACLWQRCERPGQALKAALVFGILSFWLLTPFFRGSVPNDVWYLVYLVAMLLFALQLALVGAVVWLLRRQSLPIAAGGAALIATFVEWSVASVFGAFLVLHLPAADSPLSQLAYFVGPFGVSFFLYALNFMIVPKWTASGFAIARRVSAAAFLLAIGVLAGLLSYRQVRVPPLAFSALIVQPHHPILSLGELSSEREFRWVVLDRLTRKALADGDVDLIVWPEASLEPSEWSDTPLDNATRAPGLRGDSLSMGLNEFAGLQATSYRTNCLVGLMVRENEGDFYNSACIITLDGRRLRYDKRKLLWLVESLPGFLDLPWCRRAVVRELKVAPSVRRGTASEALGFRKRTGETVRLGVVICYEMYFPELPQFRDAENMDAYVHITDDSVFREYPSFSRYESWTCQYRAITTRKWQILCNNWSHSGIVDPRGEWLSRLPSQPAVLRIQP